MLSTLKVLWNANACDLCWYIIPWSSLMWPKDYLNMCHILYYNSSVNFLQSTWIRPQNIFQTKILVVRSLVNHHPVNIIISKDKGMLEQPGLSALSQWHDTIHLQKKVAKVYLWNAIVTKHLALTIWHSNIYWNDNVYWLVIDKWCHNQNLGLEDFLWAYPSTLKKINRNIIIKYMAHI